MALKGSTLVPRIDLTGKRFGRITVLSRSHKNAASQYFWKCECDCGQKLICRGASLKNGNTASCGCLRRELAGAKNRTHGKTHTPEYASWRHMKDRCVKPGDKNFAGYGGRGISVCARWMNSFENFIADMGQRPGPKYSIERIDNDGNYEPSNCVWATAKEQNCNRRTIGAIENFSDERLIQEFFRRGLHKKLDTFCAY